MRSALLFGAALALILLIPTQVTSAQGEDALQGTMPQIFLWMYNVPIAMAKLLLHTVSGCILQAFGAQRYFRRHTPFHRRVAVGDPGGAVRNKLLELRASLGILWPHAILGDPGCGDSLLPFRKCII